jgi:hypothetical protein
VEPVAQLVLFEVFFGQIFQVPLGKGHSRGSRDDNAVLFAADFNGCAEVSGLAVDLEAVVEKGIKGGNVENFIGDRARAVDGELEGGTAGGFFLVDGGGVGGGASCNSGSGHLKNYYLLPGFTNRLLNGHPRGSHFDLAKIEHEIYHYLSELFLKRYHFSWIRKAKICISFLIWENFTLKKLNF